MSRTQTLGQSVTVVKVKGKGVDLCLIEGQGHCFQSMVSGTFNIQCISVVFGTDMTYVHMM